MTIKELVFMLDQNTIGKKGINEWLEALKGLSRDHQRIALDCADHFGLIEVDERADFNDVVKL